MPGLGIDSSNGTGITIGGTTAFARNVVSGNSGNNVELDGDSSDLIAGNDLGTDATGTIAIGGSQDGLQLNGAFMNTIGGTAAAPAT